MSQDARPHDAAPLAEADVYEVCRQFVAAYALPALPVEHIVQGWQNRASLPAGTNNYAVISVLFDTQHGTNVETFSAHDPDKTPDGVLTVKGLVELSVQVDFCAEGDVARQRAQRLAIITRSAIGVQFFNDRGMSSLFADAPRDLSFVGDAKQFVRRYSVTLHLSTNSGVAVGYSYFDTARASRVENVEVHHKPN